MDAVKLFLGLVRSPMSDARKSFELLFDEKSPNEPAASIFLVSAVAKMQSAKIFYYANHERIGDDRADELFDLFDVFADEFMNNFSDRHSHQWTSIHWHKLKEYYDGSPFAPIPYNS